VIGTVPSSSGKSQDRRDPFVINEGAFVDLNSLDNVFESIHASILARTWNRYQLVCGGGYPEIPLFFSEGKTKITDYLETIVCKGDLMPWPSMPLLGGPECQKGFHFSRDLDLTVEGV